MNYLAALDPILAILVAVGWFVVKALLNRRADADEWEEMQQPAPRPNVPERNQGTTPPRIEKPGSKALPPIILRPQRTAPAPTPPATVARRPEPIRPILVAEEEGPIRADLARLKESQESYARASQLQQTVANRLSAIDQQTSAHKPAQPKTRARVPAASQILRTFQNPATVRQAFLAQFVLNPPKSLE